MLGIISAISNHPKANENIMGAPKSEIIFGALSNL